MKKETKKLHLAKKAVIILQQRQQQNLNGGVDTVANSRRCSDTCLCGTESCYYCGPQPTYDTAK